MREANQFIATHFEIGGLSTSKDDFYRKLGWQVWRGPTFVISNEIWRSNDSENGGIMVLETAPCPRSISGAESLAKNAPATIGD